MRKAPYYPLTRAQRSSQRPVARVATPPSPTATRLALELMRENRALREEAARLAQTAGELKDG